MNQQDSDYEYYAFISYKREDEKWAKWLQKKLESYSIPTALRKKNPGLPNRIRPVFRDQSDLSGGNLKSEIEKGLDRSRYLIVICSPLSSKSPWVSKEVQYFIDRGREENIIPFIIGGTPNAADSEDECFPDCLRRLTGDKEILGININEMGRDAAAIKVIAMMFGLRFDSLWQRHERERKRRFIATLSIAVIALLSTLCIAYLYFDRKKAYDSLSRTNWELMENHAKAIASTAMSEIEKGNVVESIIALLSVSPAGDEKPYVPEVERALRLAYDKYYSNTWLYTELDGYYDFIHLTPNDKYLICENTSGIDVVTAETGKPVKHIDRKHTDEDMNGRESWGALSSKSGLRLYVIDGTEINRHDIASDSIVPCGNSLSEYINDIYFPKGISRFQSMFGSDDSCGIVSVSPDFNYTISEQEYLSASNDDCISYTLKDSAGNTLLHLDRDYEGNPFNIPDLNGITAISFSPDEKLLLLSFNDGHNEIRPLDNPTDFKIWSCGNDCVHYSNNNYFANDKRIIHTSTFENNIKIFDTGTLNLIDSVYFVGTNYVEGSYACMNQETDRLWTTQLGNPIMYEKHVKEIDKNDGYNNLQWDILNEITCEDANISCKNDRIYSTGPDGETLWSHESSLGCSLLGTADNNRLIVIVENKPRGGDEVVFLERNTGKEVYRNNYFYDTYMTEDGSSIILVDSFSGNCDYEIPGYRQLTDACRRIVGDRTMTQKGYALFNMLH